MLSTLILGDSEPTTTEAPPAITTTAPTTHPTTTPQTTKGISSTTDQMNNDPLSLAIQEQMLAGFVVNNEMDDEDRRRRGAHIVPTNVDNMVSKNRVKDGEEVFLRVHGEDAPSSQMPIKRRRHLTENVS